MFDLWSSEYSVLREKVVEHIFLAELSKALLLDLKLPFEVLRAEFDANGYDVVIEAGSVLRHVQLKATATTGRRAHVDVQTALSEKPNGCVVWLFVDPDSLALGPFLWFGRDAGRRMPSLGDREVRHSRGDASGEKKVRSGLRRLPKGEFVRFETMSELVRAMFARPDDRTVLKRHLSDREQLSDLGRLAEGLSWDRSAPLAYMIDGYVLADTIGISDPQAFSDRMRTKAEKEGVWSGTALELWLALFFEHRRDHMSGPIGINFEVDPSRLRDELCGSLIVALKSEFDD